MILFGIYALVLAGYVASASVKNSPNHEIVDGHSQLVEQQADIGLVKVDQWEGRSVQLKKEQADRKTDQQAREGRFLFPQEWYEVAFLAHFIRNIGEWLSGQFVGWMQSRGDFFQTIPEFLQPVARELEPFGDVLRSLVPIPEAWWQNQMFADAFQLFGEWISNYFVSWRQGNLATCLPLWLGGTGGPCEDPGTINMIQ